MMETDLTLDLAGWLRLLVGLPFLLGPGLAAADRWLPGERGRWILAPAASISILTLAAFFEYFVLGIAPVPFATFATSIIATLWIGGSRLRQAARRLRPGKWPRVTRPSLEALALASTVAFVMLAHALPHLPGPGDDYVGLGQRALQGVQGEDYPYPIHVDEYMHFAKAGKILRDRTIEINDPYTDAAPGEELLSISGFREERGFTLNLVQVHDLLGTPLGVLFRFLPALWSGYLALSVWYALRPAPGALASAAFVAVLPSTARFLGVGFLISSPFALPWLFCILAVTLRARGAARFFGTLLLVTGAYLQHLVIGTLGVVVAWTAMAFTPEPWPRRAGTMIATALPLLWIGPEIWTQALSAVAGTHALPFQTSVFATPGVAFYLLTVLGAAWAYWTRSQMTAPHRVLTILAILTSATMWWSIHADHRNDATYSRLLFAFFLALASLAGLGVAVATRSLGRLSDRRRIGPMIYPAVAAIVFLVVLAPAVANQLTTPQYRIHDEDSWHDAVIFESSGADTTDTFLSHPWRAPIYNAVTGSHPFSVLIPGTPPIHEEDWDYYVRSGGANATWLAQRNIDYVISTTPPNAAATHLGGHVYRIEIPAPKTL